MNTEAIVSAVMSRHTDDVQNNSLHTISPARSAFLVLNERDRRYEFDTQAGSVDDVAAELIEMYDLDIDRAKALAARFTNDEDMASKGTGIVVLATASLTVEEIASLDWSVLRLFAGVTSLYYDRTRGPAIVGKVMNEIRAGASTDPREVERRIMVVGDTPIVCD